ncbi:ORFIII-like polyprotein [Tanacetum coccineum]
MVFNYRSLNDNTYKDQYSLPGINTIIQKVGNAKVFSKFDLKSGFHQVAMEEESIPWTAFLAPGGLYEWLVMPFVYIDDILVFSKNEEEHARHLNIMLQICKSNGLVLSPTKMKIAVSKIDFLGVVIGEGKIHLQPHIIKKIVEFDEESLKTKKGLRSFLGILNYASQHIPKLGILLKPLYEKTNAHGDKRLKPSDYQLIREIKRKVQQLPDLSIPPEEAHIILEVDGCMEVVAETQLGPEFVQHTPPHELVKRPERSTSSVRNISQSEGSSLSSKLKEAVRRWIVLMEENRMLNMMQICFAQNFLTKSSWAAEIFMEKKDMESKRDYIITSMTESEGLEKNKKKRIKSFLVERLIELRDGVSLALCEVVVAVGGGVAAVVVVRGGDGGGGAGRLDISSMEQPGKELIQAQNSSLQSTGRLKRDRALAYATPCVDEKGRETLICNFCQSVIRVGETSKDVEEEEEIPLRNVKRQTLGGEPTRFISLELPHIMSSLL